ncbi:hypothetical protein KIV45_22270 [Janthinobacterium lividum]|uniref:Lipoprotein n=1 Tax=Janthinobacterium lividum TaxID=29581 RepID=A0SYW6_9BURK|nr:hypothetical protein [Janthinobacterium lividum]UQV44516.1 hypothetical protein KIV45_22270 [Janthinobacterium lividum]
MRTLQIHNSFLFRLAAAICFAITLAGCTSYRFIPPDSDAGRQCVTSCGTNQQICIAGKEQVAAAQAQACEMRNVSTVSICLAVAKTDADRELCSKKRQYCSSSASGTWQCEADYRACYTQCGGRIEESE